MKTRTLRRYTPPTCTLEVLAAESALSLWAGQPVLKNLRFQLSFDDPRLPSDQRVLVRGDRTQLESLSETVEIYVQQFLGAGTPTRKRGYYNPPSHGISLEPEGLLSHQLQLGSLAANSTHPRVRLSTLQLSDLAAALDEYAREAIALPTLTQGRGWATAPNWLNLAAVVLVTVGLTTTVVKLLDRRGEPVPTTADRPESIDEQVALEAPDPEASTVPSTLPSPAIGLPSPTAGAAPKSPSFTPPSAASTKSTPATPPQGRIEGRTQPAKPPGAIAIPETESIVGLNRNQTAANPNNPLQLPPLSPAPSRVSPRQDSLGRTGAESSLGGAPANQGTLRAADSQRATSNQPGAPPGSTAFDTVPQVAEVRSYFQQRWQPPQGLTQTLEYSLWVNSDGSIQRIMPLGQAALTYLDQTGIPRAGESLVSPVQTGAGLRIRLVLSPDGTVQTFQE